MSDEREDAPEAADEAPAAAVKRKKRRKAEAADAGAPGEASAQAEASEQVEASAAPRRNEASEGRPAFARAFPADPELDALVAAFEAGDYARVRREAPRLAQKAERPEVRRAARELRRRLDADPIAIYLLAAAALLLLFLALWYWSHGHEVP